MFHTVMSSLFQSIRTRKYDFTLNDLSSIYDGSRLWKLRFGNISENGFFYLNVSTTCSERVSKRVITISISSRVEQNEASKEEQRQL